MISNPFLNFNYKNVSKKYIFFYGGPVSMHKILPSNIMSEAFSILFHRIQMFIFNSGLVC